MNIYTCVYKIHTYNLRARISFDWNSTCNVSHTRYMYKLSDSCASSWPTGCFSLSIPLIPPSTWSQPWRIFLYNSYYILLWPLKQPPPSRHPFSPKGNTLRDNGELHDLLPSPIYTFNPFCYNHQRFSFVKSVYIFLNFIQTFPTF